MNEITIDEKNFENMNSKERKTNVLNILEKVQTFTFAIGKTECAVFISVLKNCYIFGYDNAKEKYNQKIKFAPHPYDMEKIMIEMFEIVDLFMSVIGGMENLEKSILTKEGLSNMIKMIELLSTKTDTVH